MEVNIFVKFKKQVITYTNMIDKYAIFSLEQILEKRVIK